MAISATSGASVATAKRCSAAAKRRTVETATRRDARAEISAAAHAATPAIRSPGAVVVSASEQVRQVAAKEERKTRKCSLCGADDTEGHSVFQYTKTPSQPTGYRRGKKICPNASDEANAPKKYAGAILFRDACQQEKKVAG
jgi:hypothetical protein